MKYDLIICTTAVTRPDLHATIFPDYVKFLEGLNCLWLFNIDPILGKDVNDTVSNLNTIIQPYGNIQVDYRLTEEGGKRDSFYNACKYLIERALLYKNESKYGVLWLEDDWKYVGVKSLTHLLSAQSIEIRDYVMLTKRDDKTILSFNPGVWGWELFEEICYQGIQKPFTEKNNNPERACVYPIEEMSKRVKEVYKYHSFQDAGRKWQRTHNLNRTFKLHFKPIQ